MKKNIWTITFFILLLVVNGYKVFAMSNLLESASGRVVKVENKNVKKGLISKKSEEKIRKIYTKKIDQVEKKDSLELKGRQEIYNPMK